MRFDLRTTLTCLLAVGMLALIVPFGSLGDVQQTNLPHGRLASMAAVRTNLSGSACSTVTVSGTPVEDNWILTFATATDTTWYVSATGQRINRTNIELLAATDTTTTLISGLQIILGSTVTATDRVRISAYDEVPLRADTDSTLIVTTLATNHRYNPTTSGLGGFHYEKPCSGSTADTLRTPSSGNQIVLDGIAWSWVVEEGANTQDTLHFAIYQGASMTDSVFSWTGTPSQYETADHKVHPFTIALKPDSALCIKSANGVRSTADWITVYLPGVEKLAE